MRAKKKKVSGRSPSFEGRSAVDRRGLHGHDKGGKGGGFSGAKGGGYKK